MAKNSTSATPNIIGSNEATYTGDQLQEAIFAINRLYQSRAELATQLGKQYEGKRDVYKAAGYKKEIEFLDYDAKYTRQDIAGRVVDAPAIATWSEPPEIRDGDEGETPFTKMWEKLVNFNKLVDSIDDQKSIWHFLTRIDMMSGIGRYGVLLVGINDGLDLDKPLTKNTPFSTSPDTPKIPAQFLYLSPYDEKAADINSVSNSPKSRRFNLPETYTISMSADLLNVDGPTIRQTVHWSRVIHVAEGLRNNEIFGTSRLEGIYNRLDDLEKILAASGEAAWRLAQKGIIASARKGKELTDDDDAHKSAVEDFVHDLTRYLEVEGMDITVLGGEIVDPTGIVKSFVSIISAETGIPQRMLLGSEAGHLASEQDERNWASRITTRQIEYAEPVILRPLISRLIYSGILPSPTSGGYQVIWPSVMKLSALEESERRGKEASALSAAVGPEKLPIETYLKEFLGWTDDQITVLFETRVKEMNFQNGDFNIGFPR